MPELSRPKLKLPLRCAFCGDPLPVPLKKKNQRFHELCQPAFHAAVRAWGYEQVCQGNVTKRQLFKYVPKTMHWLPPAGYTRSGYRKAGTKR